MKRLSLFRLPILWLYLGPPVFRLYGDRMAMDSLEGGQDVWNLFRFAWWLFWGIIAVLELLRAPEALRLFLRDLRLLPWFTLAWLAALFVSVFVSPSPVFTLANVVLLSVLILAALDVGLKLTRGLLSIRDLMRKLMGLSLAMMAVIYGLYVAYPEMVGFQSYSGFRVRGNAVAYTPLIADVLIFTSLYLWVTGRHPRRWLLLLVTAWGLWWLYMGQTRSAYLSFVIGAAVFAWHWGALARNYVRTASLGALAMAGLCGLFLLYGISHTVRWKVDAVIDRNLLRDEQAIKDADFAAESLTSLNGRTQVAAILIGATVTHPLGLGFVAGPRYLLQSDEMVATLNSISFGNAHNAYIEVFAGSGLPGFAALLLLIGWVLWHARSFRSPDAALVRLLLYVVLVQALFESEMVLPFKQSSALFWLLVASVAALRAGHLQRHRRHPRPLRSPHPAPPSSARPPLVPS